MTNFPKIIENRTQYMEALSRIDLLMDYPKPKGSDLYNEYQILKLLITKYDDEDEKLEPLPDAHPISLIKMRMEQLSIQSKDLIEIFGNKGNISKVLNLKRRLSLDNIRGLSKLLKMPIELLATEYKLIGVKTEQFQVNQV